MLRHAVLWLETADRADKRYPIPPELMVLNMTSTCFRDLGMGVMTIERIAKYSWATLLMKCTTHSECPFILPALFSSNVHPHMILIVEILKVDFTLPEILILGRIWAIYELWWCDGILILYALILTFDFMIED